MLWKTGSSGGRSRSRSALKVPGTSRRSRRARSAKLISRKENLARDDEALDLRGAFVDLEQLRVAHELLDRILLDVAVAAEDLHCVRGHLHRRVGREPLGIRRLECGALPPVEHPRSLPGQQAGSLDL